MGNICLQFVAKIWVGIADFILKLQSKMFMAAEPSREELICQPKLKINGLYGPDKNIAIKQKDIPRKLQTNLEEVKNKPVCF